MISSISGQNKMLRDAGSKPKDTSYRKAEANRYSARVSSDQRRQKSETRASNINMDKTPAKVIKGSYEGLMYSKTAVLQPNGSGYDKKSLQSGRYNKKFAQSSDLGIAMANALPKNKGYSIIDNYSSKSAANSSSDRLSSIVQNNMMFK